MSQKIITKILNYASDLGADNLTITRLPGDIRFDCYLAAERTWSLALPAKLEKEFWPALKNLFAISPHDLTSGKYGHLPTGRKNLNFYLSVRPEGEGEKIIINLIKRPPKIWRLNQVGLTQTDLKKIKALLRLKKGLIVVSSLPNQGKSATLAALLLESNRPDSNIYWLSGEKSKPDYELAGVSYLPASKANWEKLLNHDSDLIFCDDPINAVSLEMAIGAATSGRLVAVSLEAESLAKAQKIILAADKKERLKRGGLKMIINQHLVAWPQAKSKSKLLSSTAKREFIGRFNLWYS